MRIQQLSQQLANQIAAGEVVDRPASIVKEVVENSLDAGATHIQIDIETAGMHLIRVSDNGAGIHPDDLILALRSHATSKIQNLYDLENICSMGFRGEALASISSVSRLTLKSRLAEQEQAWQIHADGHTIANAIMPTALANGTVVEVRDLFFNTPARRKFLRSEKTEFTHIADVVSRFALCHFKIAFTLTHNKREIFSLKPALDQLQQEKRINKLCGIGFLKHGLHLQAEASDVQLTGWLATPEFSSSQSNLQYIYVNNRIVRDRMLTHAVREAYGNQLNDGRYAAYLLYLTVPPHSVDVNVHPTKNEVRFHEARLIHDFIVNRVRFALSGEKNNFVEAVAPVEILKNYPRAPERQAIYVKENLEHLTQLYTVAPAATEQTTTLSFGKLLDILQGKYLLIENAQGLLIIEARAAQAYLRQEKIQDKLSQGKLAARPLLMPQTLQLNQKIVNRAEQHFELLERLGFVVTVINENSLMLRKVPIDVDIADYQKLLVSLLEKENLTDQQLIEILVSHAHYSLSEQNKNSLFLELAKTWKKNGERLPESVAHQLSVVGLEKLFR